MPSLANRIPANCARNSLPPFVWNRTLQGMAEKRQLQRPNVRRVGRPRGRPPSELELRHLQLLLEVRGRAQTYGRVYDERLEDFVLELREAGCSVGSIAAAIGVGGSTIQHWTNNARARRA